MTTSLLRGVLCHHLETDLRPKKISRWRGLSSQCLNKDGLFRVMDLFLERRVERIVGIQFQIQLVSLKQNQSCCFEERILKLL
jgi:hypothetical protein